ncbi:hypothetical protein LTR84_003392 [Exophiala bonariae]|uniref:Nephrocystin 3-like N-terminal domain-containing protein n=1 Tax=Exophiala bonariae TaxID=1690606 RepID=A0AAV9N7Y7_9EURO|nr:hypothetical protein LTR84_003392 [Exophiala bonariae]
MATSTHEPSKPRKRRRLSPSDYTVACISPLALELAPLRAMLDGIHEDLPRHRNHNAYVLGELGQHNVVMVVLSEIGNNHSGIAALGGGVPSAGLQKADSVRLGDIVVSQPTDIAGGVIQFDRGKRLDGDLFLRTGCLAKPPAFLTAAVEVLKAKHLQEGNQIRELISDMTKRYQNMKTDYIFPGIEQDQLFESEYSHVGTETCRDCDTSRLRPREARSDPSVRIHYGTIGSSNCVIKSSVERDNLRDTYKIKCVEMEAAGLIDAFPSCLVIRDICDYSDSHKNKQWQPFAAAAAAAYAKELLLTIPSLQQQNSTHMSLRMSPESYCEPARETSGNNTFNPQSLQPPAGDAAVHQKLLGSLLFERMDSRLANIARPLSKTCQWIFKQQMFETWLAGDDVEEHHGFLWIKGKPGSGKSTVMVKVLRTLEKEKPSDVTISYFFNARASDSLEKSVLGMYRSLVYQLLQKCPRLNGLFTKAFASKLYNDVVEEWTTVELQGFLLDVVESLGGQALNILIDALDEGDEEDIRQMIAFLEECTSESVESSSPLRICLSSRHYPHISIRQGLHLIMERQDGQEEDIELYVRTKLISKRSKYIEMLRQKVCQKSCRVFLWVVLVIPILNKIYDRGGQLTEMEKCLDDIPETLDGVFATILAKTSDGIDQSILLLQWVLFASRSLSPDELYLASRLGSRSTCANEENLPSEDTDLLSDDANLPPDDTVSRYLLDCSRGLTEITKSKPPIVQFIHESVRDFLVKHKGLATIDESLADNIEGHSNEELCKACLRYFDQHLPAYENYLLDSNPQWRGQRQLLRRFQDGKTLDLLKWVQYRNTFLPQRFQIRRYTDSIHLLYILADNNMHDLLKTLLEEPVDVNITGQRYESALQAACVAGNFDSATLLLQNGAEPIIRTANYQLALKSAIKKERKAMLNLLLSFDLSKKSDVLGNMIFTALEVRNNDAFQTLLKTGADPNFQKKNGNTPLYEAAGRGDLHAVSLLIKTTAHVNATGGHYGNALQAAAACGHESVVQLLIENKAQVNAEGGAYGNALQAAAACDHESVVQLLIENKAQVNAEGGAYGNALQAAAACDRESVVRLLIKNGARVNAEGGAYGNALQAAAAYGRESTVRLLIESGASVDDALRGAIVSTQAGATELLLESEQAVKAELKRGLQDIVQSLIDHGTDVNVRHSEIDDAKMCSNKWKLTQALFSAELSRAGVSVDDICAANVLEAAIMRDKSSQMVEILLKNGANANSRGPNRLFPTVLHIAVLTNDYEASKLLISFGADVNAQGGPFGNVLGAAEALNHWRITDLLVNNGARREPPS